MGEAGGQNLGHLLARGIVYVPLGALFLVCPENVVCFLCPLYIIKHTSD